MCCQEPNCCIFRILTSFYPKKKNNNNGAIYVFIVEINEKTKQNRQLMMICRVKPPGRSGKRSGL